MLQKSMNEGAGTIRICKPRKPVCVSRFLIGKIRRRNGIFEVLMSIYNDEGLNS